MELLQETSIENLQQRTKSSFVKMSASFADPLKAEECFQKLNQMKDNSIFKDLAQLLDGKTNSLTSCNFRVSYLFMIICISNRKNSTVLFLS